MKDSGDEIKQKSTAAILALTIHGLLFLLLYFFVIKTPIPPFPESGSSGLEVNFGISETGSGDQQASYSEEEVSSSESSSQVAQETEEEPVLTADNGEDTPVREPKKKQPKKKKEKSVTKQESAPPASSNNTSASKEVKPEEPQTPKAMALYGGKKKSSKGSDGNTGGSGDQGDPEGNSDVKVYGKRTGSGTGGEGEGSGDGQGSGAGSGSGAGKPVSFSLTGRKASNLPVPRDRFDEAGRVVVEIFVDKQGLVKRAKAGIKGSTTSNPTLLEIAKKAALKSVFSVSEEAPDEQRGTIIYNFILN